MKLLPLLLLTACTTQPTWHEALSRFGPGVRKVQGLRTEGASQYANDPYTAACVAYCNARMVLVRPGDTEDLLAFWQTVMTNRPKENR